MPIIFTIANAGTEDSKNFDYEFSLDGNSVCDGKLKIDALTETNITCSWSTSYGYHMGNIKLDINGKVDEDNEDNNLQQVYIPFLDRPYMHLDLNEWNDVLKPYCTDKNNKIPYPICDWYSRFVAEDFNNNWIGNDVDPRAKKGRENAITCLSNDYDMSKIQCQYAKNHLLGWASRPLESYNNVQSIHELSHVGMIYDLMFPTLTQQEQELVSKELHAICQKISSDVKLQIDDSSISGDNGKGFGAGMGGFCYSIIGEYQENPTLIQELDDKYWGKNLADEWMNREKSYLQSFKDDAWSKYQERWLYKFYSQVHLVENFWFEKRFGLNDIDTYQNALCSMGREFVTDILDYTYNGNKLRNDENRKFRGVQAGDSNSYEDQSSDSILNWAIADYYGVLCDDVNTKKALLYLRNIAYDIGDSQIALPDMYVYKQLQEQVNTPENPSSLFPKVIFDNANDILTIRTNYSYINDNVIQIDGGEEKGSGHSQAQGYYLYALGEPFLDYEQVPLEDDVRAETWKNGISLQNDPQTKEGERSFYSAYCGKAPLNQYYGMTDCPVPKYPENYPNNRNFPLEYGGDLEDYIGTKDAKFAGVYVWRPYKNADPVKEYFIKFGDLLAKRTIVSSNEEGKGVYHNFINVYNEFTESRNGNDITLTRNDKNLDINLIYSNQSFTLGGGQSGLNLCFAKTDCSGIHRGSSQYRRDYLYTSSNDVDFILAHHWYLNGKKQSISAISGDDKGMQQGSNLIIFDTNNDGKVIYSDKAATGWGIVFNDETKGIGAFNTNSIKSSGVELFSSDIPISVHLQRFPDKILLTVNTMERNLYIDYPKKAKVTIDAQELTNNKDFAITKDESKIEKISESGTKVTFEVTSGQNSDLYIITGGEVGTPADVAPPAVTFLGNDSTTNQSSVVKAVTDENANLTVLWGYESSLSSTAINKSFLKTNSVLLSSLNSNALVYYKAISCDISGNCASSEMKNFTTMALGSNFAPAISSYKPSSSSIQLNFTSSLTFSITASDKDNDELSYYWLLNNELDATNAILAYTFSKLGIYNITAIVSDKRSNVSRSWTVTAINDTVEAVKPTILKFDWSPPTLFTDIYWKTTSSADSRVEYGLNKDLGIVRSLPKETLIHEITLANLSKGTTYFFKITSCNSAGCDSSSLQNFTTVEINASKYDGTTTDFSKLDFDNISNLILEKSVFGKIEFRGKINITRAVSIDSYTNLSSNRFYVDTSGLPELNVSAIITFYNLSIANPRILRDGIPCPDTVCRIINTTASTVTFNVTGFSEYTVEEAPVASTSSGSTSSSSSGGGGGGSGGSSFTYVCSYEWNCSDWSECSNSLQIRSCDFVKIAQHSQERECPSSENKPETTQACMQLTEETLIPSKNVTEEEKTPTSLDLKISIPPAYRKIKPGDNLKATISISASGIKDGSEAKVKYLLTDSQNKAFFEESENLALSDEISYLKSFKIPSNISKGLYSVLAHIDHESLSAKSAASFEVTSAIKSIWSRLTARVTDINAFPTKIGLPPLYIIAIVLSSFILILAAARRFSKPTENPALAQLSIEEKELYNYVAKALNKGLTASKIKSILMGVGWKSEVVDKVINAALRR